ncbi:MAG: M28 family peptidase [Acidobacteriota bacterium]|nr:M28 family peptidase [Acidobacteriota bacterium]
MLTILSVPAVADESAGELRQPGEKHLEEIVQLTFGGENAEAYWSPDGEELVFQSTRPPYGCDQIFRIPADGSGEAKLVSTGLGRTTCAYFTADGERVLYASTHEADTACPPPPDRSQGYVWPLYDGYRIYSAKLDGSDVQALTEGGAYDAEATVCPVDGSIIFTSTRDGDLELYRMDADGGNVQRLTETPGYDGGAFFSRDCSKIVWRASRPAPGEELEDFQRLLSQGLVRPGELELWVADADGSNARQVTYLGAATFAPYFYPAGQRILFSSNYGDSPREFELWAVNVDGTELERVTHSPGFDGFPMFSPDGKRLAFASNRNQGKPGETNVFVARWVDGEPMVEEESAADRYRADVEWLSADERQGRGLGTEGLDEAARWIARRYADLGLDPAGDEGSFLQRFEAPVAVSVEEGTALTVGGETLAWNAEAESFRPASFSAEGSVTAPLVDAGWGITSEEHGIDDYQGLDVDGKVVLVRRFAPDIEELQDEDVRRRLSDLRYKAFNAREHGAAAVLFVDLPVGAPAEGGSGEPAAEEAPLPALTVDSKGDAGLPAVHLRRELLDRLDPGQAVTVTVDLERRMTTTANVVGRLSGSGEMEGSTEGALVIGAHFDHLGMGGAGSLAPDSHEPHNGADDNASGVAALLEAAHILAGQREQLGSDVYFVAFSGEESGLLGSTYLTRHMPAGLAVEDLRAMLNMDMVGRLRDNQLAVLGADSAEEWSDLLEAHCAELAIGCKGSGDGYGPSDQTPFYAAGVPVLHFFTGAHEDYHKPSDDVEGINAAGGARVAALVASLAGDLSASSESLTYKTAPAPAPQGDTRSYGAYLGTIPDYTGGEDEEGGVLLAGVREGSPAETAGFQRGDRLVALGETEIGDIYDFVYILRQAKPGDETSAVVEREGERVTLDVTFGRRR